MENLSKERIEELLTLAQAATPGPWVVDGSFITTRNPVDFNYNHDIVAQCWSKTEEDFVRRWQNEAYIAAANPDTLQALLRELLALRATTPTPPAPVEAKDAGLVELYALRRFKAYVHERLDEAGVDPHEEQNAINGCRIGSRLDDLLAAFRASVGANVAMLDTIRSAPAPAPVEGGSEWVVVGERKPEFLPDKVTYGSAPDEDDYDEEDAIQCRKSGVVLVFAKPYSNSDKHEVTTATYRGPNEWLTPEDEWLLWEVTHWMPLPSPPAPTTTGEKGGSDE